MGEKIVVGPFNRGLTKNREPFVIDNDAFPTLVNAYQWRGRIKRKRGTSLLCRLKRYFDSTSLSYNSGSLTITLNAAGAGNLLTGFSLQSIGNIVPGSVTITAPGPNVYTDLGMDGTLSPTGSINYGTGQIIIAAEAGNLVSAVFRYYPDLPVMGLENLNLNADEFSETMAFDTVYSYIIQRTTPYLAHDVSFYKNPPSSGTYVQKSVVSPVKWNGQNYQQFWTTNYQGSLWATNGIPVPFNANNIGMQFKPIVTLSVTSATTVDFQITGHDLQVGDFLFINETTGADSGELNFQTGYVTTRINANNVTVTFPGAAFSGPYPVAGANGLAQYLTRSADATKDCIRWYDGDPTNTSAITPTLTGTKGWVNFCPPLSSADASIADLPADQYYLVSARMIIPFKDRILFLGPVVQSSSTGPFYLQDTIIYSQNGTPYYTASFSGSVTSATTTYTPALLPANQTSSASAFFTDIPGFGGWISAGFASPITSVNSNEDVLIVGFTNRQTRLVYTGNDLIPFNFFVINSEYGTQSIFSTVNFDRGVASMGARGLIQTSQVETQRIDLAIPDQIFQINLTSNGSERTTAQRDYINEWVYFTYTSNEFRWTFPNQTLLYNYRDDSWGIFNESYTTYGQFSQTDGPTWATIGQEYETWKAWTAPWNAGVTTTLQPIVIGGNQQGFVLRRQSDTQEDSSLMIQNISFPVTITGATNANPCVLTATNTYVAGQTVKITGVGGMTQLNGNTYTITATTATTITLSVDSTLFGVYTIGGTATPPLIYSPQHNLNNDDYITISGAIGTTSALNGKVFYVTDATTNELNLVNPNGSISSGTYFGGGEITRMYVPLIQSKQFPTSWGMARKTRIGPQQYLFTGTESAQVTLQIYLSMNDADPYNFGPVVPANNVDNNSLIYSDVLYTCPESSNLGLTAPNTNLQMVTASEQQQIWHRMNTSLLGDTVQIGITLSDEQMSDENFVNQFSEIEFHGMILDVNPSMVLA